jgi:hypothetical protein
VALQIVEPDPPAEVVVAHSSFKSKALTSSA